MSPGQQVPGRETARAAEQAFELAAARRWRSHDPYDLLLAPFGRRLQERSWLASRVAVQAGRRSGPRLRRILHAPEHEEPKALADFLRAAVMLAAAGESWASGYVDELSARLAASATATPQGRGFGLAFPYASRFVNVAAGIPNLYTTTAACRALIDCHRHAGRPADLEAALSGVGFILDGLGAFERNGKTWLRYYPALDTQTINVQASAAALLAEAAHLGVGERAAGAADQAVLTVLACQRDDGSWPYSDDGRASFVDGFHTGFTLQGLAEYERARAGSAVPGVADAVALGYRFFTEQLLTVAGLPRGVAGGRVSLDVQNVAQAVQTLVVCGDVEQGGGAAFRLWRRTIAGLLGSARRSSLRWELGPAVLATAFLHESFALVAP